MQEGGGSICPAKYMSWPCLAPSSIPEHFCSIPAALPIAIAGRHIHPITIHSTVRACPSLTAAALFRLEQCRPSVLVLCLDIHSLLSQQPHYCLLSPPRRLVQQ